MAGNRRPDMGIQAAQKRALPRWHAIHRGRCGFHADAGAQCAEQPVFVRDVHQTDCGREDRRFAHDRIQDGNATRLVAVRPGLRDDHFKIARREGHHRGLQFRKGGNWYRALQIRRVRSEPARRPKSQLRLLGRRRTVGQGHLQDSHQSLRPCRRAAVEWS